MATDRNARAKNLYLTKIGRGPSWEDVQAKVERLCEERGWHWGTPIPSLYDIHHPMRVAKSFPIAGNFEKMEKDWAESQMESGGGGGKLINSWRVPAHDVMIVQDGNGRFVLRMPHDGWRQRAQLNGVILRSGSGRWQAELKAQSCLSEMVKEQQYASYILNNMFLESSKRSGVTYLFRKGLPTIAMRFTEDPKKSKFLAALCLHPLAYYVDTFVGSMAPSDEVIAHLLLMRADEHYYWRKANQHDVFDPRSGL